MLAAVAMTVVCIMSSPMTVYADENTTFENTFIEEFDPDNLRYYNSLAGNRVVTGGINSFDGIQCTSEEDCKALERYLRSEDYVLVTTDDKDITDEEYDLFTSRYDAFLSPYMKRDNSVYWTMFKVYINKQTYDDTMAELREKGDISINREVELIDSSVIINYHIWEAATKKGTAVFYINDNISDWWLNRGFLEIKSPVNAMVKLECFDDETYHVFYVKANEPFLVKLRANGYFVRAVNTQEVKEGEDSLIYNNSIHIYTKNDIDNPYKLDLTKLVEKYNVGSIDISDKPDFSWENRNNINLKDYERGKITLDDEIIQESTQKPTQESSERDEATSDSAEKNSETPTGNIIKENEEVTGITEESVIVADKLERTQLKYRIIFIGSGIFITLIIILICYLIKRKNNK